MTKTLIDELVDEIVKLEDVIWPEGLRASKKNFKNRLEIFPEGVIGYWEDGKLVGLSTSMMIYADDYKAIKSWEHITSEGNINLHSNVGNTLYIVSMGVHPDYQMRGIGGVLLEKQAKLAQKLNLEMVILGSRIPDFHKYEGKIETYLKVVNDDGYSIDSLIRFYQKNGFEIVDIKSNYMKDDKESRNYGVIMQRKVET